MSISVAEVWVIIDHNFNDAYINLTHDENEDSDIIHHTTLRDYIKSFKINTFMIHKINTMSTTESGSNIRFINNEKDEIGTMRKINKYIDNMCLIDQ